MRDSTQSDPQASISVDAKSATMGTVITAATINVEHVTVAGASNAAPALVTTHDRQSKRWGSQSRALLLVTLLALCGLVAVALVALAVPDSQDTGAPAPPESGVPELPATAPTPVIGTDVTTHFEALELTVRAELELHRGGQWVARDRASDTAVRNGDQVRLQIAVNRAAYLFVFLYSSGDRTLSTIHPTGSTATLVRRQTLTVPAPELFFSVFGKPGTERFIVIATDELSTALLELAQRFADETVVSEPGIEIIERGMGYGFVAPSKLDQRTLAGDDASLVEFVAANTARSVWTVIDFQHEGDP